jgi:hypothetical protein
MQRIDSEVPGTVIRGGRRCEEPFAVTSSPLASSSVPRHLVRGAVGLVATVIALVAAGSVGPVALLLLPVAAIAWRGCPTCWMVGLISTRHACRMRSPS